MSDEELNSEQQDDMFHAEAATAETENQNESGAEDQSAEKSKPNGYEKRIATLVHRERIKEQEAAQLKAELETLKALQDNKEPEPAPDFPSDDLRFDDPDKYRQQLEAYNRHVARQEFESLERQRTEAEQNRQAKEQEQKKQGEFQEIVQTYIEGGITSGISEDKMAANERILQSKNLDQGLAKELYSDQYGAKIVDFLADNPAKLDEIASLTPYQAAVKIATEIKPQALSSKPLSTNAPDPIEPTTGGGMPPSDGLKWIGGAKFE